MRSKCYESSSLDKVVDVLYLALLMGRDTIEGRKAAEGESHRCLYLHLRERLLALRDPPTARSPSPAHDGEFQGERVLSPPSFLSRNEDNKESWMGAASTNRVLIKEKILALGFEPTT